MEPTTDIINTLSDRKATLQLEMMLRDRLDRRLSQEEIGAYIGIGGSSISEYISGKQAPSNRMRERLRMTLKALRGDFGELPSPGAAAPDAAAIRAMVEERCTPPPPPPVASPKAKPRGFQVSLVNLNERMARVEEKLDALLALWTK